MATEEEFSVQMEGSPEAGYVVVARPGVVFIEARIDTDDNATDMQQLREALQAQLSSPKNDTPIELGEDIMADPDNSVILGTLYEKYKGIIKSLKLVEYVGEKKFSIFYSLNGVNIKLQVYQLHDTELSHDATELPEAEINDMPHVRFEGQWDELVFDSDVKKDLIWMMTNIGIVLHSQITKADFPVAQIILLYGPPGTGKTSLCQGLAQKISIRLNSSYKRTKLIQIKTATLLSKYYSESAKQVDAIFTTIVRMCQEDPEQFVCVLIDEVESIAFSREQGAHHGESQDSLRATNSLLTGLDRAKSCTNVIFLCTSNMLDSLDSAFLDRCGLRIAVDPPSKHSQYAILRGRIQKLIDQGYIKSERRFPSYDEASIEWKAGVGKASKHGATLLAILELFKSGKEVTSGRSLTQLPELAILRYLRWEDCTLAVALSFMHRLVMSQHGVHVPGARYEDVDREDKFLTASMGIELQRHTKEVENATDSPQAEASTAVELRGHKRNFSGINDEKRVKR
ncbi:Pachytene checkpoint protein 2-like protein [Lachnellula suecica]|uniref:Pachytene checkpoint protein 2-like protein n=1 Tax=Lachnellula suecica TaxID=602035 RepID=A0A8T9C4I9_9HELO|nr:Pachytene checkpoint protein 2-like protein [Lachnellula suecica]